MKKVGFTLAEVLLTLAIIGVVAALTIPAVITKVNQDQYVVGLKKAFNTLKGVERNATFDHGPMYTWENSGDSEVDFNTYFKPYLDILKDCGRSVECFAPDAKYMNGNQLIDEMAVMRGIYSFSTSDGMSWVFYSDVAPTYVVYADVNGLKGPNKLGRDIFGFMGYGMTTYEGASSVYGFKPSGAYSILGVLSNSTNINNGCKEDSTSYGYSCTAKVLAEGAMNY